MVVAGDFKNGLTFDMDGVVYQVIEFQHVKPGKGAAFVRTKIKNVGECAHRNIGGVNCNKYCRGNYFWDKSNQRRFEIPG